MKERALPRVEAETGPPIKRNTVLPMSKIHAKRFTILGVLATAAIAVAAAPTASADEGSFIWRLDNNDLVEFSGPTAGALDAGYRACLMSYQGVPDRAIIVALDASPYYNFDITAAEEVFYVALEELC